MNRYLIDPQIILEIFLDNKSQCSDLFHTLLKSNNEIYLTSSIIPLIMQEISQDPEIILRLEQDILPYIKIISTTGEDIREALHEINYDQALASITFKRLCSDGYILSYNENYTSMGLKIVHPDDVIPLIERDIYTSKRKIPLIDLKREYRYYLEEIESAILKGSSQGNYINGPELLELEKKLENYLQCRHAICVSSGSSALLISLKAICINKYNQECFDKSHQIITTPYTFIATASAILHSGATPVFIDIDPKTYNIDIQKIKSYLKSHNTNVVGIIPVHLFGYPCNMDELLDISKEYNIFLLEDSAQSFGSKWNGRYTGTIGDIGIYSFYPTKNLGAYGDAGLIATNNTQLSELCRILINHGGADQYNAKYIGYNARMDTLQANILLTKLKYINEFLYNRISIAQQYIEGLIPVKEILLPYNQNINPVNNIIHSYNQFTIRVRNGQRDALQTFLQQQNISTMIYYPRPLHTMEAFKDRVMIPMPLIESEKASMELLSLPISPLQTVQETDQVIQWIQNFYKQRYQLN